MASAENLLWSIAAHGLSDRTPGLSAPPSDETWAALLTKLDRQRLSGLALRAEADGALPLTVEQHVELAEVHRRAMIGVLRIEQGLLAVADTCESAGIDLRVLKGAFAAHVLYDDPAERIYGDMDLLVPAEAMDRAVGVLTRLGFRRLFPELRPGFDRRFGKAVTLEDGAGLQVDLHRTLLMGPHGLLLEPSAFFATREEIIVGGRTLQGLDRENQALHAAFTVALGDRSPRPVAARDLALLLHDEALDTQVLRERAARATATAVLARALVITGEALGLEDAGLLPWARAYRPQPREVRLMRSYLDPASGYALKALDAARVLPTVRGRASFLWAVGVPRRHFLERQGTTQWQWLQRGKRALLAQARR